MSGLVPTGWLQALKWVHLLTTLGMFVVIWDVQLRRYPAFRSVIEDDFPAFHAQHTVSISLIVVPLMLGELASAAALVLLPEVTAFSNLQRWTGLALVLLAWASTFFIQVPIHNRLAQGYDLTLIDRLIATNWIRTVLWSLRAALVLTSR
ncbi:MAG: hypothetical protein AAF355_01345 [Myxococcota bacterium]